MFAITIVKLRSIIDEHLDFRIKVSQSLMMWELTEAIILKPSNSWPSFPSTFARVWSGTKIRPFPCFWSLWSLMYLQMSLTIWPLEALGIPMMVCRSGLTLTSFVIFLHPKCTVRCIRLFRRWALASRPGTFGFCLFLIWWFLL